VSSSGPQLHAEPLPAPARVEMPGEFQPHRLIRRTGPVIAVLAVVALVVLLAPGLGELRHILEHAKPGWLALAIGFEALSCLSYIVMFRPVFCRHMPWRTSWEIGWAELGMGSILPASGIGGLALGAWILHQGGMPSDKIARRSVAFFLLKGAVNFTAVAVLGAAMALGLLGPDVSIWLTAPFAVVAVLGIVLVLLIPRLGPGEPAGEDASRLRRAVAASRATLIGGVTEALALLRRRDPLLIVGAIGYWAWDNAVLWATFHAFGYAPPISIVLMGYLIGQMGGLLPLPGGLGGIDAGLFGTLVLYGTPVTVTAAAVLAYRIILFWLPLIVGAISFVSLRRGLNRPDRPDLCVVPAAT